MLRRGRPANVSYTKATFTSEICPALSTCTVDKLLKIITGDRRNGVEGGKVRIAMASDIRVKAKRNAEVAYATVFSPAIEPFESVKREVCSLIFKTEVNRIQTSKRGQPNKFGNGVSREEGLSRVCEILGKSLDNVSTVVVSANAGGGAATKLNVVKTPKTTTKKATSDNARIAKLEAELNELRAFVVRNLSTK
jgi:hypothetical protein